MPAGSGVCESCARRRRVVAQRSDEVESEEEALGAPWGARGVGVCSMAFFVFCGVVCVCVLRARSVASCYGYCLLFSLLSLFYLAVSKTSKSNHGRWARRVDSG